MTAPLIGVTTHRKQHGKAIGLVWPLSTSYCEAVLVSGGAPVLLPCSLPEESLQRLFERLDGLILTGGGDVHPRYYGETPIDDLDDLDERRDQAEISLTQWAIDARIPYLAICRGIQVMNVALGGSLYQDIASAYPGAVEHDNRDDAHDKLAHSVTLDPQSRMSELLDERDLQVNSRHHQAIKQLAPILSPAAWSEDDLIEAVELRGHPFALGVQWHPEALLDRTESLTLFRSLIEACHRGRA
jgi:putative glutamine amidotransferase